MMRIAPLLMSAAFVLFGCGGTGSPRHDGAGADSVLASVVDNNKTTADDNETTADDDLSLALEGDDPVMALTAIYQSFADEYNSDDWRNVDTGQRERFMSNELRSAYNMAGEIGIANEDIVFDWDIWIDAQDYDMLRIEGAELIERGGDSAKVKLRICLVENTENVITFSMKKEGAQWCIDDFIEKNSSLKQIALNYINEYGKNQ